MSGELFFLIDSVCPNFLQLSIVNAICWQYSFRLKKVYRKSVINIVNTKILAIFFQSTKLIELKLPILTSDFRVQLISTIKNGFKTLKFL